MDTGEGLVTPETFLRETLKRLPDDPDIFDLAVNALREAAEGEAA